LVNRGLIRASVFLLKLFSDYRLLLQKNLLKRSSLILLAAITWFIIATVLFTLPGTAFPSEDWLDKIWFDKWVHIGIFALLVVLWCLAWKSLKQNKESSADLKRAFWTIAIIFIAYGVAIEFIQKYFIPFRSFDVTDMIADTIGSSLGVFFCIRRYIKK
jgi:VanZ like protein